MLEIAHLNKSFRHKAVLRDFTFSFRQGVYGLLGPNGSGKTTLLRCITGIYSVGKECISWNGRLVRDDSNYLSQLGYLPQNFGMFKELTVREMLLLMASLKEMPRSQAEEEIPLLLEQADLSGQGEEKVGVLSGGMIRRLGIAQVFLNDPQLLIFDEPTVGLDPEERLRFKNRISEISQEKTVLISTHIVEDVEAVCDQVAVIKEGRIAASGSCHEISRYAQGKVYVVEEKESETLRGTVHILKHFEEDGRQMLRVLSGEPQGRPPAEPTVEDGYICILKDVKSFEKA